MQIAIVDDRADDRAELSESCRQVNFQLVFMDIYMENMDGMEAARRLRQLNVPCRDHNRMSLYLKKSMCIKILSFLHNSETE